MVEGASSCDSDSLVSLFLDTLYYLLCDYEDFWIPPATGSSLLVLKSFKSRLDPGSSTGSRAGLRASPQAGVAPPLWA